MPPVGLLEPALLFPLLLWLAWSDLRERRLPDIANAALAASGLALGLISWPDQFAARVVGLIVGAATLVLVRAMYQLFRGREGLGLGDAKLLGAIGAWIGWQGLPSCVLLSTVLAILVTTALHLRALNQLREHRIPFGAYLCVGCGAIWGFGPITFN